MFLVNAPCRRRMGRLASLSLALLLLASSAAFADTVTVTADEALIWNHPSGVSYVVTQIAKDTTLDVIRHLGDWYEVVLPPGASTEKSGFVRASQVTLDSTGPMSEAARSIATANAGSTRIRTRPAFLNLDVTYRAGSQDLTRTATAFGDTYSEAGSITSNYGKGSGLQFDVMGSQAIWGQIGIGLGLSYYQRKTPTTVDASVPHPLVPDQPRTATLETSTPEGSELALHIPLVWIPVSGTHVKILVFGGPSIFRVSQHIVSGVTLDDPAPYNAVAITGVTTTTTLQSTNVGFHMGGDVGYFFSNAIGVGAGVRYSRAKIAFKNDVGTTDGLAGGMQIVTGLRFRF
jgi:hypothetical protein